MTSFPAFLLQAVTTVVVGFVVMAVIAFVFAAAVLAVRAVLEKAE